MSARTPKPGDLLHCVDGHAVVVEPGTTPIDGLIILLKAEYGGDPFAPDNPALVAALPGVRIVVWVSCSQAYRDEHCDSEADDWWASDGDGRRSITVAFYEGDIFSLGDDARYPDGCHE